MYNVNMVYEKGVYSMRNKWNKFKQIFEIAWDIATWVLLIISIVSLIKHW